MWSDDALAATHPLPAPKKELTTTTQRHQEHHPEVGAGGKQLALIVNICFAREA
jgi:hypothetical protein